jgi:hypothetical protein
MAPGATPKKVINVPTRTLDRILEQAGSPAAFDFLSMDVEGPEIDALRGFDIARWQPKLILIEGHVADFSKHRYLNAAGYGSVGGTRTMVVYPARIHGPMPMV